MKTQLKRKTLGSQLPSFPAAPVRNATVPNQYVDAERLHEALQTLTATRTALLAACDQADLASSRAGTPLRTQNVRSQIELLTNEVRIIASRIAEAVAGELAQRHGVAAGVGTALSARRPNEIDREFDPRDRSGRFDPRFRAERDNARGRGRDQGFDQEWEFLHRSLRDPRWYRVARSTNQTGAIVPNLLTQLASGSGSKSAKPPKPVILGPPNPLTVEQALTKVRELLKDGGWGEDRLMNGELKTLVKLFLSLGSATATAVIAKLTDSELKLIADDIDSSGLGNYDGLSSSEKEAFIVDLATKLDAKQFGRIAVAFDDPEQIARVLARTKDSWPAKQGFFAYCEEKFAKLQARLRDNLEGDTWSNSAAYLLASLSAGELVTAVSNPKASPEFLQSLFRSAAGFRTGSVTARGADGTSYTDTQYWFEPTLLLKLNELALQFPEAAAAMRFLVFQQTIEALAWAKGISSISSDDASLKTVLLAANNVLNPHPILYLRIHSAEQDTYEEWIVQLLKSGEAELVKALLAKAGLESEGGDFRSTGYVLGIVQRAANRVDRDNERKIELAVGLTGGLLNALPAAQQVVAALYLEILNDARKLTANGMNLGDVLMHSLKTALAGDANIQSRDQLQQGYADAIDSRNVTR